MQVIVDSLIFLMGWLVLLPLISRSLISGVLHALLAPFIGTLVVTFAFITSFILPFGAKLPLIILCALGLLQVGFFLKKHEKLCKTYLIASWQQGCLIFVGYLILSFVVSYWNFYIFTIDSQEYDGAAWFLANGGTIWTDVIDLNQIINARMIVLPAMQAFGYLLGLDYYANFVSTYTIWSLVTSAWMINKAIDCPWRIRFPLVLMYILSLIGGSAFFHKALAWQMTNAPAMASYLTAICLLLLYIKDSHCAYLILAGIMLGLSTLTRTEFLLYAMLPVIFIAPSVAARNFSPWSIFIASYFAVALPWRMLTLPFIKWNYFHFGGKYTTIFLTIDFITAAVLTFFIRRSISLRIVPILGIISPMLFFLTLLVLPPQYMQGIQFGFRYAADHGWKSVLFVVGPYLILAVLIFRGYEILRFLLPSVLTYLILHSFSFMHFAGSSAELNMVSNTNLRTLVHIYPVAMMTAIFVWQRMFIK